MAHITFPHINLRKNGRLLGFGSSAKRDWKIIFYSATILFLLIACFALELFLTAGKGDMTVDKQTNTAGPVDLSALKKVTDYYTAKDAALGTVEKTKETSLDPSQ